MITITATIPSGEALSNAVGLGGNGLVGIIMPDDWTDAVLTFAVPRVGDDDGDPRDIVDSAGEEISYTVAAGQYVAVDPLLWLGVVDVVVRSGASGDEVNQDADREIKLVVQELT